MKIEFADKSYIEFKKSDHPDKIVILIAAVDPSNPLKKITNAVEVTVQQFNELISEVK